MDSSTTRADYRQWDMHEIIISLGSHATTDNLAENPEFTVTFATADTMIASDYVGIVSGRNTPDKMEKAGWTVEKAPNVNAPVFKEFPMTLECRVKQKIDESETGYYLVAEIVNILCDEKYLAEDGKPDVEKMELITFDPVHHTYIQLGKTVGNAFSDLHQVHSRREPLQGSPVPGKQSQTDCVDWNGRHQGSIC